VQATSPASSSKAVSGHRIQGGGVGGEFFLFVCEEGRGAEIFRIMSSLTLSELGVLFDWDGVIIDSSVQHEESWERLAQEERQSLPADHFKRGFGMKNERIIPELLGWAHDVAEIRRLSLRKEALYRDIVRERGIAALPGVAVFLSRLRDAGVPFSVGSSTHRENIDTILGVLGFTGLFSGIVTAEDVKLGKPHPDVFLKAAEKIGRLPGNCVVFEDAFVGIEAARAGGMKVVGVATTHPLGGLEAKVDRVVHQLDELSVSDLLALWN
jgi:HAD superfamily hydrolase (TIGR01509 family)